MTTGVLKKGRERLGGEYSFQSLAVPENSLSPIQWQFVLLVTQSTQFPYSIKRQFKIKLYSLFSLFFKRSQKDDMLGSTVDSLNQSGIILF